MSKWSCLDAHLQSSLEASIIISIKDSTRYPLWFDVLDSIRNSSSNSIWISLELFRGISFEVLSGK